MSDWVEGTPPVGSWEEPSTLRTGQREFRADFAQAQVDPALSIDRRVDAVTFNMKVRPSIGPDNLSDNSKGLLARAWIVTAETAGEVSLRRSSLGVDELEAGEQGEFEPPFILFTYEGVQLTEVDLAFDQNGAAVVCAERPTGFGGAPEVWLYFFDNEVGAYTFTSFGPGRSPRTVLDDPLDKAGNSDVVVFYIDGLTNELVYRQQRDRYNVKYVADYYTPSAFNRLLDVALGQEPRILVWYASHDEASGTYEPAQHSTQLYPVRARDDEFGILNNEVITLELKRLQWEIEDRDVFAVSMGNVVVELRLSAPILESLQKEEGTHTPAISVDQLLVKALIIEAARQKEDRYHLPAIAVQTMQVIKYLVEHMQPTETDYHAPAISVQRLELTA